MPSLAAVLSAHGRQAEKELAGVVGPSLRERSVGKVDDLDGRGREIPPSRLDAAAFDLVRPGLTEVRGEALGL